VIDVRFLRVAEAEVDEAIAYFDGQRAGLGERFEAALLDAVQFIARRPLAGPVIGGRVRKFGLRTFRYNVIYVADADEVVIVAVAHHRRRPAYWRDRLQQLT